MGVTHKKVLFLRKGGSSRYQRARLKLHNGATHAGWQEQSDGKQTGSAMTMVFVGEGDEPTWMVMVSPGPPLSVNVSTLPALLPNTCTHRVFLVKKKNGSETGCNIGTDSRTLDTEQQGREKHGGGWTNCQTTCNNGGGLKSQTPTRKTLSAGRSLQMQRWYRANAQSRKFPCCRRWNR